MTFKTTVKSCHFSMILKCNSYLLALTLSITFPWLIQGSILGKRPRAFPHQRQIIINNMGGRNVEVFQMEMTMADDKTTAPQSGGEYKYTSVGEIAYGADRSITSFVGHEYQIREQPGMQSGKCLYEECRLLEFTVTDGDVQEVYIDKNFHLSFTDKSARAKQEVQDLWDDCQKEANDKQQKEKDDNNNNNNNDEVDNDEDTVLGGINALAECMSRKLDETLSADEEEVDFQSKILRNMAPQVPKYACGDPKFFHWNPILQHKWSYEESAGDLVANFLEAAPKFKDYQVYTLHQRPTSSIIAVAGFASEEECKAVRGSGNDKANGDSIPFLSVNSDPTLLSFASKIYQFVRDTMGWESLDFQDQYALGHELFDIHKDPVGMEILKICESNTTDDTVTTTDTSDEAKGSVAEVEIGSDGTQQEVAAETETLSSQEESVAAETTEEDKENPSKEAEEGSADQEPCRLAGAPPEEVPTTRVDISGNDLATFFLFCDQPESLGGLHFPYAGVNFRPVPNMAVLAIHRYLENPPGFDGYVEDYQLCPNHHVYTHTFSKPNQ